MKLARVLKIFFSTRPIFVGLVFMGVGGLVGFLVLRDYATQGLITIGQIVWVIVFFGAGFFIFLRGVRGLFLHF